MSKKPRKPRSDNDGFSIDECGNVNLEEMLFYEPYLARGLAYKLLQYASWRDYKK